MPEGEGVGAGRGAGVAGAAFGSVMPVSHSAGNPNRRRTVLPERVLVAPLDARAVTVSAAPESSRLATRSATRSGRPNAASTRLTETLRCQAANDALTERSTLHGSGTLTR